MAVRLASLSDAELGDLGRRVERLQRDPVAGAGVSDTDIPFLVGVVAVAVGLVGFYAAVWVVIGLACRAQKDCF